MQAVYASALGIIATRVLRSLADAPLTADESRYAHRLIARIIARSSSSRVQLRSMNLALDNQRFDRMVAEIH